MRYTPEEKNRMDQLLEIFGECIRSSKAFEIVYLEKVGFIYFSLAKDKPESFDWIDDYEDLCEILCSEIMHDVRDLKLAGCHSSYKSFPEEIEEARSRIISYLDQIADDKDRAFCFNVMNDFLDESAI